MLRVGSHLEAARGPARSLRGPSRGGRSRAAGRLSQRLPRDLGASQYADRTARLLLSLGERAPASKIRATGQLTRWQIEVARLVAEGLSNADIADRLYISLRTVTTHLDHIYIQLRFNSRTLLTRYVVEDGLADYDIIADG